MFKQQNLPPCTDEELMDCRGDVFVITPQINEPKCVEVLFNSQRIPLASSIEPVEINYDSGKCVVAPLVIYLPGSVPYQSEKAIPYKYNATMMENGKEVPLPSVVNITDMSRVTLSGRILTKARRKFHWKKNLK